VYNPLDDIVPIDGKADQTTAVVLAPVTVETNWIVCPADTVFVAGVTTTFTAGTGSGPRLNVFAVPFKEARSCTELDGPDGVPSRTANPTVTVRAAAVTVRGAFTDTPKAV
jgi:hypothetical protein